MKLSRRDLAKLWLPLATALALIGIAGLLAWLAQIDASKAERERNAASSAKNQIEQRLHEMRSEEAEIKERAQRLRQLQGAGLTGEERRLDWMETLRDAYRELGIPGMSYEFGAQTGLDSTDKGPQIWRSSPLHLQLRLLHEEDLLRFLARIQTQAGALVITRSCKLAPLPPPGDGNRNMALFGAECDMQWLTVSRPPGRK